VLAGAVVFVGAVVVLVGAVVLVGLVLCVVRASGTGAVVLLVFRGSGAVVAPVGTGASVIVVVGPGTVCCTVTAGPGTVTVVVGPDIVTVFPGVDETAAGELLPPIAARMTTNAAAPAPQPAISLAGDSAPYRPRGPRALPPRAFNQNAQPGGAGGQDGSGFQPGCGCQFRVGGAGQPGGELKVAMVSSPLGEYIQALCRRVTANRAVCALGGWWLGSR
jgi:hypothetical protein